MSKLFSTISNWLYGSKSQYAIAAGAYKQHNEVSGADAKPLDFTSHIN